MRSHHKLENNQKPTHYNKFFDASAHFDPSIEKLQDLNNFFESLRTKIAISEAEGIYILTDK